MKNEKCGAKSGVGETPFCYNEKGWANCVQPLPGEGAEGG